MTAGAAIIITGVVLGPALSRSTASSHIDAPLMTGDPQVDAADFYAFTSPEAPDTVTLMANYVPLQPPGSPLQFSTTSRYDINIDNDGDAAPDAIYRWTFRDEGDRLLNPGLVAPFGVVRSLESPNLRVKQRYRLERLTPGGEPETLIARGTVAPPHMGSLHMPDYQGLRDEAVRTLPGGGKTYAGQGADPFFTNLRTTALLRTLTPTPSASLGVPTNVHSLALQLPKKELALGNDPERNPVFGTWTTVERVKVNITGGTADSYRSVSRLGNGAFNENFVDCGRLMVCPANDRYNASDPVNDGSFGSLQDGVLDNQKARYMEPWTGMRPPTGRRDDLYEAFLTGIAKGNEGPVDTDLNSLGLNADVDPSRIVPAEMIRLNMATPVTAEPNKLGLIGGDPQGTPNGRRLTDDVSASVFGIVYGALTDKNVTVGPEYLGDKPTKPLQAGFPYLAVPLHI